MILIHPYRLVLARSSAARKIIFTCTSEVWSFLGLGFTAVAAVAGHFGLPWLYVAMLLLEVFCDTNDGYVYDEHEHGIANGYGLYLDHVLDAAGAALAAYGGYALVGHPVACALGLALYYVIAIHSWLYKIAQNARGDVHALYYAVTVSRRRGYQLEVDDLVIAMSVIALTQWIPLLYVLDGLLFVVFVIKFVRAALELRAHMWRAT